MMIIEAIYARRAVRNYTDEQVSEPKVRELLEAAIQAPSAVNTQPWAFVVIQDKALLNEISDRSIQILRNRPLAPELKATIEQLGFNVFYNAGTLILICAKPTGAHPDWDCCFAAENLMLAARGLGLGSCF